MSTPIFAWDNGDLLVFDSRDRMLAYVEWQDVEDGAYDVFDGEGRRLQLEVRPSTSAGARSQPEIVVTSVDDSPSQREELVGILRRALDSVSRAPATDDLPTLVAEARRVFAERHT
jgi:hypothetical protein